ncbi:MAG: NAD(P)/FAD-dependent oxidoreductase [Lysinibacillus sp.]
MEIVNGQLFWPHTYIKEPHTNPEISPFYDAIIVGGGISGVLSAKALMDEGLKVAILDKGIPGEASTSANTGLLQYSNDVMLHELIEQIGKKDAVRFYELCKTAVDDLEQLSGTMLNKADFIRRPSVYYASRKKHKKKLQKEFETLLRFGFPVDYWGRLVVEKKMGFDKPAALLTYDDAEFNPYKFAHELLKQLKERGLHVFENTPVHVIEDEKEEIVIHTVEGIFHTKKIIYTTGYHELPFGKIKGANIQRSYALVTRPIPNFEGWYEKALIWETARPYLYLRTTVDKRIIIGGLDEKRGKAPGEKKIQKHAKKLLEELHELFPQYDIKADYLYGASFGNSKDSLPFIGEHPERPNHYYLLGLGGNGTVYSMLGAKILADLVMGRENDDAHLVRLDREYGMKK